MPTPTSPVLVPLSTSQTLLFDADDTLWENNIYFEQAITAFISYLDHRVHTAAEVREHLNHCERATTAQFGYGLKSFQISLIRCFEELTIAPVAPGHRDRIVTFAASIADREMELLPGVFKTLTSLAQRHRLIMVTKGDLTEQTEKLRRSGLAPLFAAVEVLMEKNEPAYLDIADRYTCQLNSTWMVGNSPKSDVNPALAAGLNAIFIPHDSTWILEHEMIASPPPGQRLLEIPTFADLLQHF